MNSFNLTQVVTELTQCGHDGTLSLIDLVLLSAPDSLRECQIIPPLANSDHLGIFLKVKRSSSVHQPRRRQVMWSSDSGDFERANALISKMVLPVSLLIKWLTTAGYSGKMPFWKS